MPVLQKRRVLFVLSGTFAPIGGMYEYMRAWLNHASDKFLDVAVAASPAVCREVCESYKCFPIQGDTSSHDSCKRLIISKTFNTRIAKNFICSLKAAVDEFSPDVIHMLDIALYADYIVSYLLRNANTCNILLTLHDPDPRKESSGIIASLLRKRLYKRLIAMARSQPQFFLHIHDLRLIENCEFPGDVKFIEMPHPLPRRIAKRSRPLWNGRSGKFRIGFLGRISPYKGLDELYEAISWCLSQENFDREKIEIMIAGPGKFDRAPWEKLPVKIIILNYLLQEAEFHQHVSDLDLLILPYRKASQSGVAAMGVSYGIPILATKVGALDSFVIEGRNGFLVESQRHIELGKKLIELITDRILYSNMLVSARKKLIEGDIIS